MSCKKEKRYNKFSLIDKKDIKIVLGEVKSKRAALRKLGCDDNNGNELILLNKFIKSHRIDIGHHSYSFDINKVKDIIEGCYSLVDIAKKLRLVEENTTKINSRLCKKLTNYIKDNNLDTSHFKYKKHSGRTINDEEVFCKNSKAANQTVKKRFLLLVEYKCILCGISKWNGSFLSLQMDHVDGDNSNNELSNLRLLCPNCHSQTSTYGIKNAKFRQRDREVEFV